MENVKTITLNINCGIENESDQTIAETFKLLISTLKGETVLVNDLKVLDFSSRINLKEKPRFDFRRRAKSGQLRV